MPADRGVVLAAATAGVGAAALLPEEWTGIGWLLAAVVFIGAVWTVASRLAPRLPSPGTRPVEPVWMLLALALAAAGSLQSADWFFALCALAAVLAATLAVGHARSVRAMLSHVVWLPVAALRGLPWIRPAVKGKAGARPMRTVAAVVVGICLLAIFGGLLGSADAAFGQVLADLLPTVDVESPVRWVFLFAFGGLAAVGFCYLLVAPPPVPDHGLKAQGRLRRIEWALPVGLLVALFALFVAVQLATLFGGDDHVQRTVGLTYAEYARGGFWQLAAVTVLTLLVIAIAAKFAATRTPADRAWLRGLLGGLACLTLVIVASALTRMWAYQQAYGFTTLRLLVGACEIWLGVVYLLVLAAGIRLRTGWLPRAVVGSGMVVLLALAALTPDRFIAERNVARYAATGRIDINYLFGLSADAVEPLSRLPEPARSCALDTMAARLERDTDWRSWTPARSSARELLPVSGSARYESCLVFVTGSAEGR